MRTANECLVKAIEMEARGEHCSETTMRADFLEMAQQWRLLSILAEWQDRYILVATQAAASRGVARH